MTYVSLIAKLTYFLVLLHQLNENYGQRICISIANDGTHFENGI